MANEFEIAHGTDVTLLFGVTNLAQSVSVDGAFAQAGAGTGFTVPAGYNFHPLLIQSTTNDARTAGISTAKVTAAGVEVTNGPEAELNATDTLVATGLAEPYKAPVATGVEVGVSCTQDGSFTPVTADATVMLVGKLIRNS